MFMISMQAQLLFFKFFILPYLTISILHLQFYDKSTVVAALGNGTVLMLKVKGQNMQVVHQWKGVHHYKY